MTPLTHGLVTTDRVSHAFSDEALVGAMCRFEAGLARAESAVGVIPNAAGSTIADVALRATDEDIEALRASLRAHATLSMAVVASLTDRVGQVDADAARFVHFGATSQDVYDTAMVLCLREAWASIENDHLRLISALDALAVRHADVVMLGRTLMQPAVPTTFGLKAAGWLGAVVRSWRAWSVAFDRTQVLQFGGAAGTLASLGTHGIAVEQALGEELDLEVPDGPWHTHRDRVVGFVAAAGIYVGALGKIATDIALLMQAEVGEAFEPGGGSSTMPHKRNPSKSTAVLACAHRMPGLVATMMAAMPQEHERAAGGWQAESATLVDAAQTSSAAVAALADAIERLTIDEARMRRNIDATGGAIFAERLSLRLRAEVGRERAEALTKAAVETSARSGRPMVEVVAETPELARLVDGPARAELFDPRRYLGSADAFRVRLLSRAAVPGAKKQ